jgi:ribosomal protein S18 acetylase RimI-like enzyme
MTTISPSGSDSTAPGASPKAVRIPQSLRQSACERLVTGPDHQHAARNLISSAPIHGIDLDLLWGVVIQNEPNLPQVRQTCLAVLGAGKTAMLFHSSPESNRALGTKKTQRDEISACISACLRDLGAMPQRARLVQCLIEPRHSWAREVFLNAGMISVGELAYLRLGIASTSPNANQEPKWPAGVSVRPFTNIERGSPERDALTKALESSYAETLDCPELCGLRSLDDVIDSHQATGQFYPSHWLLIEIHGEPIGCCLLSHIPATNSIELVYLGIGPKGRGLGLGRTVLAHGIDRLRHLNVHEVTCAVDTRNEPALRIYQSLGFVQFDTRLGFVAAL